MDSSQSDERVIRTSFFGPTPNTNKQRFSLAYSQNVKERLRSLLRTIPINNTAKMSFLAKMYERRLNDNMSRNRLDLKIAPSRPKPNCRFVENNDIPHKPAALSHYHLANELKTEVPVIGQQASSSPPPTYQDSFFGQKSSNGDSQLSLLEPQRSVPAMVGIKPFKRTNSQESGFYTGGDSDVASNFSVST